MDTPLEQLRLVTKSVRRWEVDATDKLYIYVQQQWDPGMISLAFKVVDEVAIAVQQDLHNLERRWTALQLRKPQRQTPITS